MNAPTSSLRQHVGLLTGFGATDVDAIDHDAWYGLQHNPRITRAGQALQLIVRDAGGDGLTRRIDDRRFRRDVDGFGDATH